MKRSALIAGCALFCIVNIGIRHVYAQDSERERATNEQTPYVTVDLYQGHLFGEIKDHIKSYTGVSGRENELRLPIQTSLAGFGVRYTLQPTRQQDGYSFNFRWLKNNDTGSGNIEYSQKQSDDIDLTLAGSAHPGTDIYSQSDPELNVTIYEVTAALNSWHVYDLIGGPLLGYRYERFSYHGFNTNQTGFGPYNNPAYTMSVAGDSFDYGATYSIPYLGIGLDVPLSDATQTSIRIGFSPRLSIHQQEDDLPGGKTGTAQTTGEGVIASLAAQVRLSDRLFLQAGGEYMRLHTKGTKTISYYAGPQAGLRFSADGEVYTTQWNAFAVLTFNFSE